MAFLRRRGSAVVRCRAARLTRSARFSAFWPSVAWLLTLGILAPASAQLPATRVDTVVPMSGQVGQTVDVTLYGSDLDDVAALQFSHPGIQAKLKMAQPGPFDKGPQPVANQFVVTIAGNVPVGRYELRAVGKYGSSNGHTFFVSTLPTAVEVEPNQDIATATQIELPADVSGHLSATGDVDLFRFTAKANARLILDGYARRADSQADAVVVVYDVQGREVGNSRDGQRGDPLVDFSVRASQAYTIKVYDSAFRGGSDFGYRFTVGALPHIDYVFPPAATAGGNRPFTVFGRNLPSGQNAGVTIGGKPLQKQQVTIPLIANPTDLARMHVDPASGGVRATPFRVKNPVGWSNAILVGVATSPPVGEIEPNDQPQQGQVIALPCEVMGRFFPRGDADWFQFEAAAGQTLALEVLSHRQGIDTDCSIVLQQLVPSKTEGDPVVVKQLALVTNTAMADRNEEFQAGSRDPVYYFTVPADGAYRILLRDGKNAVRVDPRHVYRLAVRPAQPDYSLVAVPSHSYQSVLLRKGGQAAIRVVAYRRDGFDGEIRVSATGLPAGITCSDAIIGPGRHSATLVLNAATNAATGTARLSVVGAATVGAASVQRQARVGILVDPLLPRANMNQPQLPTAARLASDIVLSISADEQAPVALQAGGGKIWEASRAGILKIPYTRTGIFKGKISLVAAEMPANIDAPALNINPNAMSGEYQIKLKNNTPIGTYTFHLSGRAEQVDYRRNPEAAVAALARKKEVDQIAVQTAAEAKKAVAAKTAADKLAADAQVKLKAAETAKQSADQTLAQSQQAVATAGDQRKQAAAGVAAKPDDPAATAAVSAATKAVADAAAKLKSATAAVALASKTLQTATATSTTAIEAKAKAELQAATATERAKLAAELKAKTDKASTDATNAAKPKKLNVLVVSTPVTLKITPAPVVFKPIAAATIKQGEKGELPVVVQRLYAYTAAVSMRGVLPPGVSGVSIASTQVAANQTQGKFVVTASANATPGTHQITLRATMVLNSQVVTVERPVTITIQEVKPPAK